MNPKPLSDAVRKGLAYLVNQQHPEGGWSQGGGWRTNAGGGRVEGPQVQDPADVANTCMAAQTDCRSAPRGNRGTQPEIDDRTLSNVIFNQALVAPPAPSTRAAALVSRPFS